MARQPKITPEKERVARTDALAQEVASRYQERYAGERELFPHALNAYRIFLTDFVPTPRPSGQEELMAENMRSWAEEKGMQFDKDAQGNVAVILAGNPDSVLVLQHHLDIVADKTTDSPVDPHIDSIIPEHIEGKLRDLEPTEAPDEELWLQAHNAQTTLGADNGAGGAAIRAAVERLQKLRDAHDDPEAFPTVIILGTVEEEAHLGGVKNLDLSHETTALLQKADYIINDDMEMDNPRPLAIEGAFGLESMILDKKLTHEPLPQSMELMQIDWTDFFGGHSGLYAQRTHAGSALMQQLEEVLGQPSENNDWRLSSFTAGNADNQIAQEAHALVALPKKRKAALQERLATLSEKMKHIVGNNPAQLHVEDYQGRRDVLTSEDNKQTYALLSSLSRLQGTQGTFPFRDQMLYTKAFNMGIVALSPEELHIKTSTRIGQEEAFGYYPDRVKHFAEETGTTVLEKEPVQIWPPQEANPLPMLVKKAYGDLQFDKGQFPDMAVEVVTAGLELGELHQRFPQSNNITLGMWIDRIHKPGERMQIPSFLENAMLMMKLTDSLIAEMTTAKPNTTRRQTI